MFLLFLLSINLSHFTYCLLPDLLLFLLSSFFLLNLFYRTFSSNWMLLLDRNVYLLSSCTMSDVDIGRSWQHGHMSRCFLLIPSCLSCFLITWLPVFKKRRLCKILAKLWISSHLSSIVQIPPQCFAGQWKLVPWLQGSFCGKNEETKIRTSFKFLKVFPSSWKSWCAVYKSLDSVSVSGY